LIKILIELRYMETNKNNFEEFKIKAKNDTGLNLRIYRKDSFDKILVITHGYGEHQGYYVEFANYFSNRGYAVCTYDLHSHGLSEGKKGHVPSFELFLDDLDSILDFARKQVGGLPINLFGHSMGGSIVLNYLLRRSPDRIGKSVISSPWLKLAFEPPKLKLFLAQIGKNLFPSLVMKGELNPDDLSRNPEFVDRFINDPLTYDKISPGYFSTIREYGLHALSNASKLMYPILMSHGSDDNVTSSSASREFCDKCGDLCEYKLWEGYKHVVFSENDKDKIFDFYRSYLVS